MKKIILLFIFIMTAGFLFAHAPSEVTVNYDAKTSMLSVNVVHMIGSSLTTDPTKHYIKDITVSVNGKSVIVETIGFQQSANGEISSFLLKVKSGDKVSVKAVCNIAGVKITEITIK